MIARVLPPVGDPIPLVRRRDQVTAPIAATNRFVHLSSGTAALAFILQALARRAQASGSGADEVAIPAYGCPDIVSAVAFAGLEARLVDLEGTSPFPSPRAWSAAIGSRTVAVVTVGFLGMRDPFTPEEARTAGLPDGAFVEDCCQVHPMAAPSTPDRSVALSFGRGKPVSVLHGGAALLVPELTPHAPGLAGRGGSAGESARIAIATRLYNLLRSPRLYGWVTRLPGLGVGDTEYAPLDAIEPMNPNVRARLDLSRGWNDARRRALQRRLRQHLSDTRVTAVATDVWAAHGAEDDWLLRYPLLLRNRGMRDEALARLNSSGLGASPMYGRALENIAGVGPHIRASARATGAATFAERLLTLPLHADVRDQDLTEMCDILRRMGRS